MANPSRFSMIARLVNGNAAEPYPGPVHPDRDEQKIAGGIFVAVLHMVVNGELTKEQVVVRHNLTHPDDGTDLDNFLSWYTRADNRELFVDVLERRIMLARDKRTIQGGIDLDGAFGFAVKDKLLNGVDGAHPLATVTTRV